ncbi:MAG TPA: MBL fold metallo-hydrolase [Clostridia bacterium]|nr:MBL fold metallo-hydrolase [Clostridia bacterium]
MDVCTLYSGSSGNSLLIRSKNTALLVDAGLSARHIVSALEEVKLVPQQLNGVLLTHEHIDHIKGAGILSRRFKLPIYANEATWTSAEPLLGRIEEENKMVFETGSCFEIGDLKIESFAVPHDAAEPVGFTFTDAKASFAMATDLGTPTELVKKNLFNADCIFLESNHDEEMLKTGSYPWPLKKRILSKYGHLSNGAAGSFLPEVIGNKTEQVFLGHLSKENNLPELAYLTVANLLLEAGIKPKEQINLTVTYRDKVSKLVKLGEK